MDSSVGAQRGPLGVSMRSDLEAPGIRADGCEDDVPRCLVTLPVGGEMGRLLAGDEHLTS